MRETARLFLKQECFFIVTNKNEGSKVCTVVVKRQYYLNSTNYIKGIYILYIKLIETFPRTKHICYFYTLNL